MSIRPATHAGSWYLSDANELAEQLNEFSDKALSEQGGVLQGSKAIISPHAGYSYCGSTMAKAYVKLDLNKDITRIFILGPSHHFYFRNKAFVSRFEVLETPLGNLHVDTEIVRKLLQDTGLFGELDYESDQEEHSLEMQYPMLYQTILRANRSPENIKIVPILVSANSSEIDYALGRCFSDYLKDRNSSFIISSDFCHWGRRFAYTGYVDSFDKISEAISGGFEMESIISLKDREARSLGISESIKLLDHYAMNILAGKDENKKDKYPLWKQYLQVTSNTICGEKPIGVFLCALSFLNGSHSFTWSGYSQSSVVKSIYDSSVSYAAGYCVI